MLICYCFGVFNGCSLHFKKFQWLFTLIFFMFFLPLHPQSFFVVQEFIPKDDITNEPFGPSNSVLGLNTPSIICYYNIDPTLNRCRLRDYFDFQYTTCIGSICYSNIATFIDTFVQSMFTAKNNNQLVGIIEHVEEVGIKPNEEITNQLVEQVEIIDQTQLN